MGEEKSSKMTPLSEFGEFNLIKHLTKNIKIKNQSTLKGIEDDAAVFRHSATHVSLVSCDMLIEGVHFNIRYTPLKHLGYKAAVVNFSDIYAMNGIPLQMVVAIAVSNRYSVESLEELYEGINAACEKYGVDFVGGDTTSSSAGMQISVTVLGEVMPEKICYRNGAKPNDLICVSGDVGSAYAGLLILQREDKTFLANPNHKPDLKTYNYVVERQLKPEAKKHIIELLNNNNIVPTSMIDISDGLSSELLHIAEQSKTGLQIYEEKIPIHSQTYEVAEEFNINALTISLNGGEDYELLFTVDINKYDTVKTIPDISIIGHITADEISKFLITSSGQSVDLKAQGWKAF